MLNLSMTMKPLDITAATRYTYWDSSEGFICPLCASRLKHEFNNGGRRIATLKGALWVVTNYYSCTNQDCEMHQAFPAVYPSSLSRKRHSLNVWAKVIQHYFKHHLNYGCVKDTTSSYDRLLRSFSLRHKDLPFSLMINNPIRFQRTYYYCKPL